MNEAKTVDVKVPPLAESVTEATVAAWHKQPGEPVTRDENLVDLETEKVVLEVPAPCDGTLAEIVRATGEDVVVDDLLGRIREGPTPRPEKPVAAGQASEPTPSEPGHEAEEQGPAAMPRDLSPAVRRLVAEHGLDPGEIDGSGRGGRVTKEDVLTYLERREAPQRDAPPEARGPAPADEAPAAKPPPASERPEERVPMTRIRQRIAERLVETQQTTATLTTFNEINMQALLDLRARLRERFEEAHGVRLGMMSFFVKAAVEALRRFPVLNASIDGTDVIYHGYYDIGIAVSAPRGLVVPVLRDADRLSFADIEHQIRDFAARAQDGRLTMEELAGGTFTITNGGVFGSMLSTPIINPPQTGILGMHKIEQRPVAEKGEVAVRPVMYAALSYDHRLIDGREAVQFLVAIKESVEDPDRLLLGV